MSDVLTSGQRRLNMSRIKGRDTKPELLIRRGLHERGLRYRLHVRSMPGTPDLVFPRFRTVVFINGCFWHQHGCKFSKLPVTRVDFWRKKFEGNVARDNAAIKSILSSRWRVIVVWECAMRGRPQDAQTEMLDSLALSIRSGSSGLLEIIG
jgi:DNA mismatch endonuclease (patch repair protein)